MSFGLSCKYNSFPLDAPESKSILERICSNSNFIQNFNLIGIFGEKGVADMDSRKMKSLFDPVKAKVL